MRDTHTHAIFCDHSLTVGSKWNYISVHIRWPGFPGFSQMLLRDWLQARSYQQYTNLSLSPKLPQSSPLSISSPSQLSGSLLIQNVRLNEREQKDLLFNCITLYIWSRRCHSRHKPVFQWRSVHPQPPAFFHRVSQAKPEPIISVSHNSFYSLWQKFLQERMVTRELKKKKTKQLIRKSKNK